MTLKTHMILSYHTTAAGATPTLFRQKWVEAISLQKNEFNQKKWWMSALANVLCELSCWICEFLFLKLPCYMKRVRKSRELELYCIIFKTCTLQICSTIFYVQFHHKMWIWFWKLITIDWMQHNHYKIHYWILCPVTLSWSFLHCIVVLCDCMMKRDSHGYYRKMNWWHLTDLRNLKNQDKDLVAGKNSYQCHHCPGA